MISCFVACFLVCVVTVSSATTPVGVPEVYYSPNRHQNMPAKTEGEYCNVIQICLRGLSCQNQTCVDANKRPSDASGRCNARGLYPDEEAKLSITSDAECECYGCWTGPTCAIPKNDCVISPIDPEMLFYADWLASHVPPVKIYPKYGQSYRGFTLLSEDSPDRLEQALRSAIVKIHAIAGNAKTENYTILVGAGAHQLLSSAIYALSQDGPKAVFAQKPHWTRFVTIAEHANTKNATWTLEDSLPPDEVDVVEIHTVPNNPDNKYHPKRFARAHTITDMVYNWPNQQQKDQLYLRDDDIMVFSMSKFCSYPGSRLGWALVKDAEVAARMTKVMSARTQSLSVESVLRITTTLEAVVASHGTTHDFFDFGMQMIKSRYDVMTGIFDSQNEYRIISDFGVFFMVQCDSGTSELDCEATFNAAGINVRLGSRYGYSASANIIMMCIGDADPTFLLLAQRVNKLLHG